MSEGVYKCMVAAVLYLVWVFDEEVTAVLLSGYLVLQCSSSCCTHCQVADPI